MKYRIKQEVDGYYIQYKFLFMWLYCTYQVHGATVRESFNSICKAKQFVLERKKENVKKVPPVYYYL